MSNNLILLLALVAAAAFIGFRLFAARPGLSPAEADKARKAGQAVIVDVREPAEWASGVATGALLLPFSDLRAGRAHWNPAIEQHRGRQFLLYCHSGARSAQAAALLRREGHDAVNIGGLAAWRRAGLPVRPPGTGKAVP